MNLTENDLRIIFDALEAKYGRGYSDEPAVCKLQAKLSILLEVRIRENACGE